MENSEVKIIAGPCSVDEQNLSEIHDIADMKVRIGGVLKPAIYGTRVVGLKSRSAIDAAGNGMGIDFEIIRKNVKLLNGGNGYAIDELEQLPSIRLAMKIISDTGLLVSTEVMFPAMQMPLMERAGLPRDKVMVWNPAVNQLGWQILEMATVAGKNGWQVGLKNPKWLGKQFSVAEVPDFPGETSLEKTWKGLASFAEEASGIVLIHRGVDVDFDENGRGDYRNIPVHNTAMRTKLALNKDRKKGDAGSRENGVRAGKKIELFFDPSHSFGPKMRGDIPQAVIDALKMKAGENEYLYDGVLIEAGTSQTDTEQHISLDELQNIVNEIIMFRSLKVRE
jgi:hypothetical protein